MVYSQFRAVYIPADKLPEMKIDGDTSDWDWVPKRYVITEKSMYNVMNTNDHSWDCRIKAGWSDPDQKLYLMAKITDDSLVTCNSRYYLNDCMQFAINTDRGGGSYAKQNLRTNYIIKGSVVLNPDKASELMIVTGPKWITEHEKKHVNWSVRNDKNKKGEWVIVYEMCLSLWDKWTEDGPEFSLNSELYPFKRIRLALVFDDSDVPNDIRNAEWTTLAGKYWYNDADDISEFILDPPLENDISWTNIYYLLNTESGIDE
jgi:hypothetical protein